MASTTSTWPVLRAYEGEHSVRVAMPIGGIGTGTLSLGGRGQLQDFELMNRPAKGFNPASDNLGPACLALRIAGPVGCVGRLLEGPIPVTEYEGSLGTPCPWHGLPRFQHSRFLAAYPFGQVELSDPTVPAAVVLQAFNPLVPPDTGKSGLPVAVLRVQIRNTAATTMHVSVCANLPNFVGCDGAQTKIGWDGKPRLVTVAGNRNTYRKADGLRGVFLDTTAADTQAEAWGSMALSTPDAGELTYRTNWGGGRWGGARLDFWDDFLDDGRLDERSPGGDMPMASLCLERELAAGEATSFTFLITWHFPNRRVWNAQTGVFSSLPNLGEIVGNWYTTQSADAWAAAVAIAPQLASLERESLAFVDSFLKSDLPVPLKEAALFNLSTLRTQTCFRTADGHFYGFEGCHDHGGSCHGSCTHVWNYEMTTPFLFGSVARDMRELEFLHATRDDGFMNFRIHQPLVNAQQFGFAAADGQLGCLIKLYREWRLAGDDGFLRRLWPKVRRALEFCWQPGGWDANRDGVMEGCQHNTMDVEYYGPNPLMGFWYLGALRAVEEMARHLGETAFATECHRLYEQGRGYLDAKLFNGHYYRHEIRLPGSWAKVLPGLANPELSGTQPDTPDFQLGDGCLIDQLVGQWLAHTVGLGHLADVTKIQTTLRTILDQNVRRPDQCNPYRGFALGDERALVMAHYPPGKRLTKPFPYFGETMTGFEHALAAHLLWEGYETEAVNVVRDIRERYDGRKRNPFDEAECGHHYVRAMAAWGAVQAWAGCHYDAVAKRMTFAARPGTHFWATGDGWGLCHIEGNTVRLEVLGGSLAVREATIEC
ncbi:MAG: hypothetical protein PCFJNLEI_01390 [Verrucomicrobiae bacterium]|nr:hypothetical protein [Verrucomicrobiae bacterium]